MSDHEIPINHGFTFDTVDRSPETEAARKLLARLEEMKPSTTRDDHEPEPPEPQTS